jgi:3-oxoadipate enol-lactonase
MPKVKVGDINMYYKVHGKGEPLVFIAGFATGLEMWRSVIPLFSREYQLVIFDTRGAGRSDSPDIPYTADMLIDDIARLLDYLGIDKAHIRGTSMGGSLAQYFTLRYPERVISLILECTSCGGTQAVPPSAKDMEIFTNQAIIPPGERGSLDAATLGVTPEFIKKHPDIVGREIKQMQLRPVSPIGAMRQMQAQPAEGTYKRLPEIKAPTLIIHGDADRLQPVENARILASRIPNAELVIFKNAGHWMLEAGDKRNSVILDFLKRHSKSGEK